ALVGFRPKALHRGGRARDLLALQGDELTDAVAVNGATRRSRHQHSRGDNKTRCGRSNIGTRNDLGSPGHRWSARSPSVMSFPSWGLTVTSMSRYCLMAPLIFRSAPTFLS